MADVPDIIDIDHRIEVMSITDISLIMDLANLIFAQRAQPPTTVISVYFVEPLVLIKHDERLDIGDDIKMGE